MRNSQNTFETRKRSFISAFSISMTVPVGFCRQPAVISTPDVLIIMYYLSYHNSFHTRIKVNIIRMILKKKYALRFIGIMFFLLS